MAKVHTSYIVIFADKLSQGNISADRQESYLMIHLNRGRFSLFYMIMTSSDDIMIDMTTYPNEAPSDYGSHIVGRVLCPAHSC